MNMFDGYRILDADRHVIEPIEMWREHLPPEFRARAPYLEADPMREGEDPRGAAPTTRTRSPSLMLDGQPVMHKISEGARAELMKENYRRATLLYEATSPAGQLRAMDRSGIDVAFMYPTYASYVVGVDFIEPAFATALARAYNDWLRDFCQPDSERLRGVGIIALHDPEAAALEVERAAGFGFRAVVLRPNPVSGRTLAHAAYEPLWAACERHDVAVGLHEGTHARLPTAGADRFDTRFALHACSHPMEQMMALLALYEGGVFERHPGLRVGFLEAGCGWVPYWLWRLDEEYRHLAGELGGRVSVAPSVSFQRQCFVGFEPGERYLSDMLAHVGPDKLMFGTDFPHPDHDGDLAETALRLRETMQGDTLRALLWDNGARFYGLSGA
jgi:predicted TIM-barrel fold metal-dependent hydrolase